MPDSRTAQPAKKRRSLAEIATEAGPIAVTVRQRRQQLGYTQPVLAARAGVGLRFLKELEQGKPSLRVDKVNQVLYLFGMELRPCTVEPERR